MAKVQIKSEKITPFGGIFHVREQFSRFVGPVIDKVMPGTCSLACPVLLVVYLLVELTRISCELTHHPTPCLHRFPVDVN